MKSDGVFSLLPITLRSSILLVNSKSLSKLYTLARIATNIMIRLQPVSKRFSIAFYALPGVELNEDGTVVL